MRRNALFWGSILILLGALLLLQNTGILTLNVWKLIWPSFLILLGLWTLWGVLTPRASKVQAVSIPLEGASRARVHVSHGAGQLIVKSGAGSGELMNGAFGGGLDYNAQRDGEALTLKMRVQRDDFFFAPWGWGRGALDWSFSLNNSLPIALELHTGASDMQLDLADLRVTDLRVETGASSTRLTLPTQAGHTRVDIQAGAASVNLRIPPGVAARIRATGGVASIDVDQSRFPRAGVYQSVDYDTAANKAEIDVRMGAGSVDIR